jgi:hypothetical protein
MLAQTSPRVEADSWIVANTITPHEMARRRKQSSARLARGIAGRCALAVSRPQPYAKSARVGSGGNLSNVLYLMNWLEDWHAWADAVFVGLILGGVRRLMPYRHARQSRAAIDSSRPAAPASLAPRTLTRAATDVSLSSDQANWGMGLARTVADVSLSSDHATRGVAPA